MLLMQEPELLLVDEPVAGMTPQEIERTAELLQSLAGEHRWWSWSTIWTSFDRLPGASRYFTKGACLRKATWSMCRTTRASSKSISERKRAGSQSLNQFYGGSHTLWDVDLDVPAGSRTCLMGRNGMGKTTLLKCIMGLLPATPAASPLTEPI